MKSSPDCIVGAGLAGLIAAHAWPQAQILEASPQPMQQHNALLRFRSDVVARLTGIEFRKVRVRKGIYTRAYGFVPPSIALANQYSAKVLNGRLAPERSIWSVEPVDRWIAPEDLYWQMLEVCGKRIAWETNADYAGLSSRRQRVVNTAPLSVVVRALGEIDPELLAIEQALAFEKSPIVVKRWRIPACDVHQTVYFPDVDCDLYRASITGDLLIAEGVNDGLGDWHDETLIERAFGIRLAECSPMPAINQRYGKIAPVDERRRKQTLWRLTTRHGVYSLGRFATWRNILLDDVVEDVAVIKRLFRIDGEYDAAKTGHNS